MGEMTEEMTAKSRKQQRFGRVHLQGGHRGYGRSSGSSLRQSKGADVPTGALSTQFEENCQGMNCILNLVDTKRQNLSSDGGGRQGDAQIVCCTRLRCTGRVHESSSEH